MDDVEVSCRSINGWRIETCCKTEKNQRRIETWVKYGEISKERQTIYGMEKLV